MKELLELLKFQGQLILQGPPGTGKTYMAKELARKLVLETLPYEIYKDETLTNFWNEFVDEINDKELETKKERKFTVLKNKNGNLNVDRLGISITKEQVFKLLKQTKWDIENYQIEESEAYTWGVAKAFRDWLLLKNYIKIVQFHPSYTYEDFVRGIKLEVDEETKTPKYEVVNKIFAELCEEAIKNPDRNYVLIIDEINRANLPVVLGELIYALEYRDEEVETPYRVKGKGTLKVPKNLFIIGTMNTADRSIGHIDYAIRRRFVFKEILPNKDVIKHSGAKKLYEDVIEKLFQPENVSVEFRTNINDIKIGHSYFLVKDSEKERLQSSEEEDVEIKILAYKFLYQVVPLIREYIKDGILIEEKAQELIQSIFRKNLNELTVEDIISYLQK